MTKQEKKRLSVVLRATEYLFLENIALKLVLEHREVPNWQKLLERLLADKDMLAGVGLSSLILPPVVAALGMAVSLFLGLAAGFVPAVNAYRSRITDMLRTV